MNVYAFTDIIETCLKVDKSVLIVTGLARDEQVAASFPEATVVSDHEALSGHFDLFVLEGDRWMYEGGRSADWFHGVVTVRANPGAAFIFTGR